MNIYKDYQLVGDTLFRFDIDDSKHLLWSKGGIPCIDADNVWDKYKMLIKKIVMRTKKGRLFKIDTEKFDANKQEIDFGFGRQYYVEKSIWDFKDCNQNGNNYNQEEIKIIK